MAEPGAITFPLCQTLVDEWVVLDESAIRSAVRLILEQHFLLVEGAAALAVAAVRSLRDPAAAGRVALILSGSHLAVPALAEVLREG